MTEVNFDPGKESFNEGQQLLAIRWGLNGELHEYRVGFNGVTNLVVSLENGQMTAVPWVKIYRNGFCVVKSNVAFLHSVEYLKIEPTKNIDGKIRDREITPRLSNALINSGISSWNDLSRFTLRSFSEERHVGRKTMNELCSHIKKLNMSHHFEDLHSFYHDDRSP